MANKRLANTLANLEKLGLSQLLVSDPVSIFYLTGQRHFAGERLLLLHLDSRGANTLYLNELSEIKGTIEDIDIVQFALGDDSFGRIANGLDRSKPLGLDKNLPARFLIPLLERSGITDIRLGSDAVDKARQIKDERERALMALSSEINDRAMSRFEALIVEGVTEAAVRDQLAGIYKELGADRIDFGIVAFGEGAAEPHHLGGETRLQPGDCVLLDVGCVKDGYCSDMTRTFFYKSVSPRQREVYEVVRRANEAAERLVKPGVRFSELDAAARDIIEEAGFGARFTHRLGHSIGLQGHEAGDVSAYNHDTLEEGMIFSIEPGVYLPGEFGVRIEDLVLVTRDGGRILNEHPKELKILGAAD
ncbi:MAG: Xaa-Pro peptidase family protein [Oscillospiraceae bacterium]|jgi:Xaa-Pro dipeptidase|nr:Xaa-Pro peptidase family protein [Oscillospiraceae bacterium]